MSLSRPWRPAAVANRAIRVFGSAPSDHDATEKSLYSALQVYSMIDFVASKDHSN